MSRFLFILYFITACIVPSFAKVVDLGVDVFFHEGQAERLKGKKVGLITNHTGVNSDLVPTYEAFINNKQGFELVALFAPEHGFRGEAYADQACEDIPNFKGIPVYSLYGKTRRPSDKMLSGIDILIYDIQDVGSRSYTFISTLFLVMEEAAKKKIQVIVLDRPNPMGGLIVDGPMLQEKWRSFIGYVNVPYCHGMTIGELSIFFNHEYKIGCDLKVIPMRGWKRDMLFNDTHLHWVPTSPYIPEADSPHVLCNNRNNWLVELSKHRHRLYSSF
jgi:uncharacterized protein YbbC (DUF1343 family)